MVSLCVDCLAAMTVSSCENSRTYAYLHVDCLCLLIINDLMYTTLFIEQTTCKSDRIDALLSKLSIDEISMLPQIHVAGENVYLRASTVNSRNGHNHQ